MPRMENNGGDSLARGATHYTFKPMGQHLTDEEWDAMMKKEDLPIRKGVYLFACPVHGPFRSTREAFISGGYPLVDEYTKGKCPVEDCDEASVYAGFEEILEAVAL